jgi:hypothetical protein
MLSLNEDNGYVVLKSPIVNGNGLEEKKHILILKLECDFIDARLLSWKIRKDLTIPNIYLFKADNFYTLLSFKKFRWLEVRKWLFENYVPLEWRKECLNNKFLYVKFKDCLKLVNVDRNNKLDENVFLKDEFFNYAKEKFDIYGSGIKKEKEKSME